MFFIKNIPLADVPWRIENLEQGIVVDNRGRLVALVPIAVPEIRADSSHKLGQNLAYSIPLYEGMPESNQIANLHVIAHAPELLAALKEAAYHLDVAGIPLNQQFYDLINRASPGMAPLLPRSKTVDNEKN